MTLHDTWDVVDGLRVHGRANDRALKGSESQTLTPSDGRSAQPEIVFVHGLGMSTRYLEPTMLALAARGFAVSGLDLPGFGETGLGGRVASLGELADGLAGWLRVRGLTGPRAPVLVGQSHGCQVIVDALARAPEIASGVVLNAATMLEGHRTVLAQVVRMTLDSPREPLSLVPLVVREYLRSGPRRILATLGEALRDRIEEKLPRVGLPMLIVCGERDPVSPARWGQRLATLTGAIGGETPRVMFRVVPGAAHAVPFSHPEALAALIAELAGRAERVESRPRPL
jgi:pimeloyl-ACP methyl ester carboxylesterase